MEASPRWRRGKFRPHLPREEPSTTKILRDFAFRASPHRVPKTAPPIQARRGDEFASVWRGLRVTWLGHSTSLVEIDGHRVLFDPLFGPRSSPVSFAGPRRFHAPPLPLDQLPALDAVVVSHDHYDHLDHGTIVALATASDVPFVVPLGVGAHLEHWGIPAARVLELDWWDTHHVRDLAIHLVPARHFSGRSVPGRDRTLWGGVVLQGVDHRVYFSGDTAMFPGFAEIGARLGPFDVVMMESGAYNPGWRDMHIGPEQAIVAAELVGAKLLLPVHWGTFDLALHGWTEPIERIVRAAERGGMPLTTPRPGQSVVVGRPPPRERWWPDVPWQRADENLVVSTHLPEELVARVQQLAPAR